MKKIRYILSVIIMILGICGVIYFKKPFIPVNAGQSENNTETVSEPLGVDLGTQTINISNSAEKVSEITDTPLYHTEWNGTDTYKIVNNNVPFFSEDDIKSCMKDGKYQTYTKCSELDTLGRCDTATACLNISLKPTEDRKSIGHIRPSGFQTVKYPTVIDDLYLYNRGHLLSYFTTGILDDERNLTTLTRYCNLNMTEFEYEVGDYLEDHPNNHILYRSTPLFAEKNLISEGILMEAYSLEDNGSGVCFCVFIYNVQPSIHICYEDGDSWLEE